MKKSTCVITLFITTFLAFTGAAIAADYRAPNVHRGRVVAIEQRVILERRLRVPNVRTGAMLMLRNPQNHLPPVIDQIPKNWPAPSVR